MNRSFVSIFVAVSFSIVSFTGVLLYALPHLKATAEAHTFFALCFSLVIIFHIKNNFVSIQSYLSKRREGHIRKKSAVLLLFTVMLLVLTYRGVPSTQWLYEWGLKWRHAQKNSEFVSGDHEVISINSQSDGVLFNFDVRKGPSFKHPIFALWLEDISGNYLQTLYVSKNMATSEYDYGIKKNGKWYRDTVRRPEALPYWSHQRGILANDGLYIPESGQHDLDSVTGATPLNNFSIHTRANGLLPSRVHAYMEVNQSYDWNAYYHQNRFPDDSVYSGPGQVGQPALVYRAEVNLNNGTQTLLLQPVGHSHPSGRTGELYSDLSNIDTALDIVRWAVLEVNTGRKQFFTTESTEEKT